PAGGARPRPPASAAVPTDTAALPLTIPPQHVSPLEGHVIRRVVVDTDLERARVLERVGVPPQRRSVLRGALVFAGDPEDGGRWIGAWLPWQPHVEIPKSAAMSLPARARLTIDLHY